MKFCKNCGHELRDGAKVCSNCGTPVDNSLKTQNENSQNSTRSVKENRPLDSETKKKYIIIGGSILGILILLVIIFMILKSLASPISKIDSIEEAVSSNDAKAFKNSVDTKISTEEAEAYLKYVDQEIGKNQYREYIENFKEQVKHNMISPAIYDGMHTLLAAEKNGKKFLFFDNYELTIPKKNIKIDNDSDIKELKYKYDGKEVTWKNGEKFQELIPGIYSFAGTGILENDTEIDSGVNINFYPDYGEPEVTLIENYYFFGLYHDYWSSDLTKAVDKINLKLNGKDIDLVPSYEDKYGPLEYDTDYKVTGEIDLYGHKIAMKPIQFNLSKEDTENYKYNFDDFERKAEFKIEFNEKELENATENQSKKEQVESDYKYFKDNAQSEIESFVSSYLYALESMYEYNDIAEVEEFIEKGSDVETALKNNIANNLFQNMFIYDLKFSNFVEDGDYYTIDVRSKRDHDDIEETTIFNTRYGVKYDKKEGKLVLTSFTDL